jgi:F0F1-type ATP synthase assembly protein I
VATFLFACLAMLLEMLFFTSFGTRPAVFVFVIFGFSAALLEVFRKSEGVAPSPVIAPGQIGRVGAMAL